MLSDTDPELEERLRKHTDAFPKESAQLVDSASSLGGKPRTSNAANGLIPVGHISLNKEYETAGFAEPAEGLYWISTFYISSVLQSLGLGRAAMNAVESMAIAEPLCAKTLALSTVASEYESKEERWTALGREPPQVSVYI